MTHESPRDSLSSLRVEDDGAWAKLPSRIRKAASRIRRRYGRYPKARLTVHLRWRNENENFWARTAGVMMYRAYFLVHGGLALLRQAGFTCAAASGRHAEARLAFLFRRNVD